MRKRKSKKRQHKLIGFKAYTDTDADLLAWWESITPGDRSEALRELMRMSLGYQEYRPEPSSDLALVQKDTAWIRTALMDLPGYMEDVIQQVAALGMSPGTAAYNGVSTTNLADDAVQRREQRMKKTQW